MWSERNRLRKNAKIVAGIWLRKVRTRRLKGLPSRHGTEAASAVTDPLSGASGSQSCHTAREQAPDSDADVMLGQSRKDVMQADSDLPLEVRSNNSDSVARMVGEPPGGSDGGGISGVFDRSLLSNVGEHRNAAQPSQASLMVDTQSQSPRGVARFESRTLMCLSPPAMITDLADAPRWPSMGRSASSDGVSSPVVMGAVVSPSRDRSVSLTAPKSPIRAEFVVPRRGSVDDATRSRFAFDGVPKPLPQTQLRHRLLAPLRPQGKQRVRPVSATKRRGPPRLTPLPTPAGGPGSAEPSPSSTPRSNVMSNSYQHLSIPAREEAVTLTPAPPAVPPLHTPLTGTPMTPAASFTPGTPVTPARAVGKLSKLGRSMVGRGFSDNDDESASQSHLSRSHSFVAGAGQKLKLMLTRKDSSMSRDSGESPRAGDGEISVKHIKRWAQTLQDYYNDSHLSTFVNCVYRALAVILRPVSRVCARALHSSWFDRFIFFCILLNSISLASYYHNLSPMHDKVLQVCEFLFAWVFTMGECPF